MREIKAGEFKAKCLRLIDEVNETGESIIITKRGKVVARLAPAQSAKPASISGIFKGDIKIADPGDDLELWDEQMDRAVEAKLDLLAARSLGATLVTSDRSILSWRGDLDRLDAL